MSRSLTAEGQGCTQHGTVMLLYNSQRKVEELDGGWLQAEPQLTVNVAAIFTIHCLNSLERLSHWKGVLKTFHIIYVLTFVQELLRIKKLLRLPA